MFQFNKLKDDMVLNFFLSKYLVFPILLGNLMLIGIGFFRLFYKAEAFHGELGPVAFFVSGTATFIAILFGGSYWLQRRSEAAMKLLSLFNLHITNMIEIMHNPVVYQYEDYYPFAFPENKKAEGKISWERPCRLLYNEFGVLKKELAVYSSFVRGDKYDRLHELEDRIEKIVTAINHWLALKLAHNFNQEQQMVQQDYENFTRYREELIEIAADVKKFLLPYV